MARAGYKPEPLPPIVGGRCTKHGEPVTPVTKMCLSCHHERLDAAGFDWRQIGASTSGGAGGWRARNEAKVS